MSRDVEVVQVIRTNLLRRGDGKASPLRIITQYWSMEGDLLWEYDPAKERAAFNAVLASNGIEPLPDPIPPSNND